MRTELSRWTLCVNKYCVTVFPLFGAIVHVVYGQEVCVVSFLGDESPGHSFRSEKVCEGSGKGNINGRFGWDFWIEDGLFDDVKVLDGHREMSEWLSILAILVVQEMFLMFVRRRQLHLTITRDFVTKKSSRLIMI